MGFEDEMAQYDEDWERDQATARPGQLPDGRYNAAIITESRIEENRSGDGHVWVIKFEADYPGPGGEDVHGSIHKWQQLDQEIGRSIAAQDAKLLGYMGKGSGLKAACEEEFFIGKMCEIKVVTKPGADRDFTNVYVNKCIGQGEVPAGFAKDETRASASHDPDDDIPFEPTMMTSGPHGI